MASVLLTGATGFVGSYLYPALRASGHRVRCATRDPERARRRSPDREWVAVDVEDRAATAAAMEGCDAAYYLVHSMGGKAGDYADREARCASIFAAAAADQGLERIVYLGGIAPAGVPSRHLASRLRVGAILRNGTVPTIELRAAMIVGAGSASWKMVRDLAARLPLMVLPRWLRNRSWPIAIDDVIRGLVTALDLDLGGRSRWLELPGPEPVTHVELIRRVARALGKHPRMLHVPVLSPKLSSYWIGLVTSVDLQLAAELVEGCVHDLVPSGESLWQVAGLPPPMSLDAAIANALSDAGHSGVPRERMARVGAGR
jgi:uncharacterized protein YbjT (DUF2867 family)